MEFCWERLCALNHHVLTQGLSLFWYPRMHFPEQPVSRIPEFFTYSKRQWLELAVGPPTAHSFEKLNRDKNASMEE